MTPQQTIEQRLLSLDPTYRDFVLSDYFEEICGVFVDTSNLNDEQSVVLENGFVLLMTFFFDRPEFIIFAEEECGIPRSDGELLVEGFIQALPLPIVSAYEEIYSETFLSPSTNLLESEILEAEAVLKAIPKPIPHPTENVYTTTQSAILTEAKATLTTRIPPPPPSSSTPRWETE